MEKLCGALGMPDNAVTLYSYFRSSAAYRVRIALNFKRLPYKTAVCDLRQNQQGSNGYRMINPQGLVPSLETGGEILTQSIAMLEYLEDVYPEPALLPGPAMERARVRAIAQLIACDIHPLNNLSVLNYLRDELAQPNQAVERWYVHWIVKGFEALEIQLKSSNQVGLYCHGDTPSLADVCLVPQVFNAKRFNVDLAPFPIICRIVELAETTSAFVRAMPKNQPDAARSRHRSRVSEAR